MKYKLTINYEYIRDTQEEYDELVEDGYLPDEAKRQIEFNLRELAEKIDWCADNTFWGGYTEIVNVEKIDD